MSRKRISFKGSAILATALLLLASTGKSQTTLTGPHIITGNVDVGTTATKGNLTVTGTTGTTTPNLNVTGDGGAVFSGVNAYVGAIPATGDGIRFMWYPGKAALRAGPVYGGRWDDSSIGYGSVAFGQSIASGSYSFATGTGSATGNYSSSLYGNATGVNSVALSSATASGNAATAMSAGTASGTQSVAMAVGTASGAGSTAISYGLAQGDRSLAAVGGWTSTAGFYSLCIGTGSRTFSERSFIIGTNSLVYSQDVTVVGTGAIVTGTNSSTWAGTDPVFVVGNGNIADTSIPAEWDRRKNAFTVYKNGNVKITKRQGDILMGEFGNPE